MSKHALVVEGGAMRGIFAAGVLDAFLAKHFKPFDFVIGVSAGSTNSVGYLCGQKGRSHRIITEFATSHEFIDMVRWLRGGHFCDVQWLWRQSFDDVWLDFAYYEQADVPLYVVTTSILSGNAHYIRLAIENMHDVFPASCAIPLAYRDFPTVNGEPMTDGGIADSIPVKKAYEMGAKEITVILSRSLGYEKKRARVTGLMKRLFKDHPKLQSALLTRNAQYNEALQFIKQPPADCKVNVIAPPVNFKVGRFTRNPVRLEQGYESGVMSGEYFITNYSSDSIQSIQRV